jgi:hypothetical protein
MAEPLPEPPLPTTTHPLVTPEQELARKNNQWGWALFALFWVLFGATFGIAFIWIWLS